MKLRQILTGSCNVNDQCLSVGTINSFTFITYGSGSDLVILNHEFVREQIIPGCRNNNSQIFSVSCTLITGKILVLYSNNVCIYEPNFKISDEIKLGISNYLWALSSTIEVDEKNVKDLCWVPIISDTVIIVGKYLNVWKKNKVKPTFYVDSTKDKIQSWNCIWSKLGPDNTSIDFIKFSSDGKFFATLSIDSKHILIWFWDQFSLSFFDHNSESIPNELLDYIIIKHPSTIISFEWRNITNFAPRNSINNSILTCSSDNVCRIWSESHLNQYKNNLNFDDSLKENINDTKVTDHIKNLFFNYIKEKRSRNEKEINNSIINDYTYLKQDSNSVYTYPEFILSASVNDTTDIPLFTTLNSGKFIENKLPFIVHWLNNKDLNFNQQIEKYLNYFTSNITFNKSDDALNDDVLEKVSQFNRQILLALIKWKKSCDVIFSIHPQNGSLLVWFIHNLDESGGHLWDSKSLIVDKSIHVKNSQISVHSCLPNCIPIADAISMNSKILLYCDSMEFKTCDDNSNDINFQFPINYNVKMISKQHNGSLNMWNLTVSNEDNGNSSFLNIKHLSRISGHRWQTNSAACHIHLPFLLTVSNFNKKNKKYDTELSELILWRIKPIGPFSKSGGITEVARINSENYLNFTKVAWFPGTVPTFLFGIEISSPASLFIATDSQNKLSLYLSIADAKNILEKNIYHSKKYMSSLLHESESIFDIRSLTSTGEPGCILSAGVLKNGISTDKNNQKFKTLLLHVFPKDMILDNVNSQSDKRSNKNTKVDFKSKYFETYFIVRLVLKISELHEDYYQSFLEMWQVKIFDIEKEKKSNTIDDLINLQILNEKVYSEALDLPSDVIIIKAVPAASHLSSASIYPSCLAPYLITTMCTDGSVRFWKCSANYSNSNLKYEWLEWKMQLQEQYSSTIFLKKGHVPFEISCAYSGRVAIAYSTNDMLEKNKLDVNVDIYECESTGGSEWILEDIIKFSNILPISKHKHLNNSESCLYTYEDRYEISTKNHIYLKSTEFKDVIQIDWVNSEDGTHLLSIALGTKIMIFTPACLEMSKYSRFTSETSALSNFTHWMKINEMILKTADSLPPIPEYISWAREGLLIVGLDNEVHVYNQWNSQIIKSDNFNKEISDKIDKNSLNDLIKKTTTANYSLARLKDAYFSNPNFKTSASKAHLKNADNEKTQDSSDEILQNAGLFEAAQVHNPVLPQYHPKQLMEWINFGKIQRVKAILSHLTNCLSNKNLHATIVSQSNENAEIYKNSQGDDNLFEMSQLEIKAIPPLPLYVLLEMDIENENHALKRTKKESFIHMDDENFTSFNDLNQEDISNDTRINTSCELRNIPWIFLSSIKELSFFGPEQTQRLSECLTRVQLPGLSTLDQIYLLGIAELMCNLKNDISDQTATNLKCNNKNTINDKTEFNGNFVDQQISTNSMDDCGLRFLLAMQHFSYMTRTLPLNQRNILMIQGIDTSCIIWGFHSETEEELCLRLDEIASHNITWPDFRRYGCGWWIRNINILQKIIEKVAKNMFQKAKNPMDSAIFYLSIGKQKLLAKLFKNCNQTSLFNFFNLDFSIEENKSRALNQAYKMRSKRRYDHAVALFLLCNSIDDAVLICLHNLKDIQLAITISRLYDMNFNINSKKLFHFIHNHVINCADPFIRSMGYWMIEEYSKSLDSLIYETSTTSNVIGSEFTSTVSNVLNSTDTIVFIFYNFLKKHPIVLREKMVCIKNNTDRNLAINNDLNITPMERRLFFRTAYTYLKMGCPDLALEVLSKLPPNYENIFYHSKKIESVEEINDIFDLSFDHTSSEYINFQIQWDENEEIHKTHEKDIEHCETSPAGILDIMCLQYKFMICLKLISEELCTLATGIESHGSYLRYHLYTWLEKEVQVLQNMCGYSIPIEIDESNAKLPSGGILLFNDKEKSNFTIKERIKLRKIWLKANQSLIISLYSFCSLHGPNIVGLAAIRMELLILIQEIQGSSCIQTDSCKHPHTSVNLPFINSSLAPDNGLIITPCQQLKTFILEIVDCLNSFKCSFSFLYHHSRQCERNSNYEISENKNKIKLLRNQCQALSACLHQCLSNFTGIQNDEESVKYHRERRPRQSSTSVIYTADSDIQLRSKYFSESNIQTNISPNSDPMKWPGYTNLFKALGCSPKKNISNFSHLLAEALVVVYVGILVYALQLNDPNLLYRLTIIEFNKNFWGKVFGGTLRHKPNRPSDPPVQNIVKDSTKLYQDNGNIQVSPSIPRNRLYCRLSPPIRPKSPLIDETFIPPLYPLLTCLLEKPPINPKSEDFIYDSDIEDFDEDINIENEDNSELECTNSKSYTWSLLRLVILYAAQFEIKNLLNILQIENGELAIFCPNIFSIMNCLHRWQSQCKLNLYDYISMPASYSEFFVDCNKMESVEKSIKNDNSNIRFINMCKNLPNIKNCPFKSRSSAALAMKRLWINLIKKPDLQPIFLQQFLYSQNIGKEKMPDQKQSSISNFLIPESVHSSSVRIIHKDHDCLYSMAINQIDKSLLVTATSKEIIELSINNLINPEKWFQDDYQYLLNILKEPSKNFKSSCRNAENRLPNDFLLLSPTFGTSVNYLPQSSSDSTNVTLKRQVHGTQILKSHPALPYYLTGNSNGQVSVFEWGIDAPIVKTYSPIQKGKITSLNFDANGNKFGMGDSEGNFSLFHFSYADNSRAQYFQTRCPHKGVLDFCFLNSSSIVATCGGSALYGIPSVNHLHAVSGGISNFENNSVNVSIWDVLLPSGRNQVRNLCDTQLSVGVSTLCYASRYEVLIAGTKKGDIALIDIRQNNIQNIFQAHDSCITSIKLDPLQYYFITAAADGHIKIWRLFNQELLETFRSDHIKTSVFGKGDIGIKSLSIIEDNKLLSCSADGFIKLRYIEPRKLCNNLNNDIVIL